MQSIRNDNDNKSLGSSNTTYIQSANSLFHFMKDFKYLKMKIDQKCIIPRYNEEDVRFFGIQGLDTISYPMICFCDIKLHNIFPHSAVYGEYAIAFSKDFCLEKSIQPITYLNTKSNYFDNLRQAIQSCISTEINHPSYEIISDQLIYSMSYMKPLVGIQDKKYKNFHDEQEWRFIPDLTLTEMPYFVINPSEKGDYTNNLNVTMENINKTKLLFEYKDIQYLFVKNNSDRKRLIDHIIKMSITDQEKYDIISKISVLDTLRGDL